MSMGTAVTYLIDALTLGVPAFAILRYGWPAIPIGVLCVWLLPLLTTRIVGPGMESYEADYYWRRYVGWQIGIGYALLLWTIRQAFRGWLRWRRKRQDSSQGE